MRNLQLGSHGADVLALQGNLRSLIPSLVPDGQFGPRTERAVRIAQRRLGLFPPDGIAGPKTMGALFASSQRAGTRNTEGLSLSATASGTIAIISQTAKAAEKNIAAWIGQHLAPPSVIPSAIKKAVAPAMRRAEQDPSLAGVAMPVQGMRMSARGRLFIIRHEGRPGVSNRLHHPTMGSGVTLGPGYDMKDRSRSQVAGDLKSIFGVDPAVADKVAEGAGKSGQAAQDFFKTNKTVIDLKDTQQAALLANIIGHYETMVRRSVKILLHQYEFDALVSYADNHGGGWKNTIRLIDQNRPDDATVELSRHVYSKGERVRSHVTRREAESRMLLYGEYR